LRNSATVRELAGYGCLTRMHVVRLVAPRVDKEDHTKDVDFSPSGIQARWQAGYADACRSIERAPWQGKFDSLDGVILHEPGEVARLDQVVDVAVAAPGPRRAGSKAKGAVAA